MPVANIHVLAGHPRPVLQQLVSESAHALARSVDAPVDRLQVWITEVDPGLYAIAGVPADQVLTQRPRGEIEIPLIKMTLLEGRSGIFAGCISATCNLNADLCASAWHQGDAKALEKAVGIRKLFDGKPLVAGVKAGLAHLHKDEAIAAPMPPLTIWAKGDRAELGAALDRARG